MTIEQVVHQLEELRARLKNEVHVAFEDADKSIAHAKQQRWFKDLFTLLKSEMPDEIPIFQTALNLSSMTSNRPIGANPAVGMFMDRVGRPVDAYLKQLIESLKKGRRKFKPIEGIGNNNGRTRRSCFLVISSSSTVTTTP